MGNKRQDYPNVCSQTHPHACIYKSVNMHTCINTLAKRICLRVWLPFPLQIFFKCSTFSLEVPQSDVHFIFMFTFTCLLVPGAAAAFWFVCLFRSLSLQSPSIPPPFFQCCCNDVFAAPLHVTSSIRFPIIRLSGVPMRQGLPLLYRAPYLIPKTCCSSSGRLKCSQVRDDLLKLLRLLRLCSRVGNPPNPLIYGHVAPNQLLTPTNQLLDLWQ